MKVIQINTLGVNSAFDVYLDDNKIDKASNQSYIYNTNKDEVKVKLIQKHICDSKNWLSRGLLEATLGILSGIGGYSDFEENRGPYRAYFEGVIGCEEDVVMNVELKRKKISKLPLKFTYKFHVSLDGGYDGFRDEKNVFESPRYLKTRWNIIRIPYVLLGLVVLIILFLACI